MQATDDVRSPAGVHAVDHDANGQEEQGNDQQVWEPALVHSHRFANDQRPEDGDDG